MTIVESLATITWGALVINLAGLAQFGGFLMRDQLIMRLFLFTGSALFACYYLVFQNMPNWNGVFWSTLLGAANLSVIVRLLLERTTFRMPPEHRRLYEVFYNMSPGEFRRLLRKAKWITTPQDEELITAGKPNTRLFYIVRGDIRIDRTDGALKLGPGSFVGELSFLLGTKAAATVTALPDTTYIFWQHADLLKIERRHPAIRIALRERLNIDLARKVKGTAG